MSALVPLPPWYAYATGYAAFAFASHFIIHIVVTSMHRKVAGLGWEPDHKWQYPVLGITERTLYVSLLLAGYGEIIGAWVLLKVAGRYFVEAKDRNLFMNTVIGNALSVLYALTGYGIVRWWGRWLYVVGVPMILVLLTFLLILLVYPNRVEPSK